jgi:DNA modification methylase
MSPRNYAKAKAVVTARKQDRHFADLAARMDKTGNVDRAYKELKRRKTLAAREEMARSTTAGDEGLVTGEFQTKGHSVANNSVDLIFTDPPYAKESLPLYEALAKLAARVLKPGAVCLTYCGNGFVPEVLQLMQLHLRFIWMFAVQHGNRNGQQGTRIRHLRINNTFKPILGFFKPERPDDVRPNANWEKFADMPPACKREKDLHDWQQPSGEAEHFINYLCPAGGFVVDPFAGSGTTLVAAKKLGRRYIGFEIDPRAARLAQSRLAETVTPAA